MCCFRPLAGIMFLIMRQAYIKKGARRMSFRPLAGIMVLIFDALMNIQEFEWPVSVPLRGLWFLSSRVDRQSPY